MFIDRTPRGEDPWLDLKVWSFTVGALLAFAGIYLDASWLIWVAIVVLLVGFAARFLPDGADDQEPDDQEADDREADEQEAGGQEAGGQEAGEAARREKPLPEQPPLEKQPPEKPSGRGPVPEHE